jgi:hypothetical protein
LWDPAKQRPFARQAVLGSADPAPVADLGSTHTVALQECAFRNAPEQANELACTLILFFLQRKVLSLFAMGYGDHIASRPALGASTKGVFDHARNAVRLAPECCSPCPGIPIRSRLASENETGQEMLTACGFTVAVAVTFSIAAVKPRRRWNSV